MPPRRRAPARIPIDVEAIRRKLSEGRIVRVGISRSAQFPEGGTGRVRHVGDPAVDGEEFVQVELSLNGTKDILPFTPADLTPATRAKPGPEPAAPRPTARARSTRRPENTAPTVEPPTILTPTATSTSTPTGTGTSPANPSPVTPSPVTPSGAKTPPTNTSQAEPPPTESPRGTSSVGGANSARSNRGKSPRGVRRSPPVSITIATSDPEPTQWRIEARVGSRVVLRHGSVSPARVWELVRQLDEPTLSTAVGGILEEQRKTTQARADALAAELAQLRAELAALPENS